MKTFMEEYGKVIVVAIIIVALIGVALVFKTSGMESIKSIWKNFMTKSQLGLEVNDGSSGETETQKAVKTIDCWWNGKTIQYEEGMTWDEWLASDYGKDYKRIGSWICSKDDDPSMDHSDAIVCSDYVEDGWGSKKAPVIPEFIE